jgi:hypothetical protein
MSQASASALHTVGAALQDGGGRDAAAMRVAESCVDPLPAPYFCNIRDRYVAAIANVAKAGNTMLLPTASNDPAAATAAAMNIFNQASFPPPPLFWRIVTLARVLQVMKTGSPPSSGSSK